MDLSIVISLFNEAESLDELLERIHAELSEKQLKYEVIMVDDGSTDGSWEKICALKQTYGNVRGIRFRRNYGKAAASRLPKATSWSLWMPTCKTTRQKFRR